MATFTPPVVSPGVPTVLPTTPVWQLSPAIYMRGVDRGVNVFVLADGTVTQEQPWTWDLVQLCYYGGHTYEVDQEEVDRLTAAGYGAYIDTSADIFGGGAYGAGGFGGTTSDSGGTTTSSSSTTYGSGTYGSGSYGG